MTPKEATAVLAKCATYDRRKPDGEASVSWSQALHDVPLPDALVAVVAHYGSSSEWCRPAHIRARVDDLRRARLAAAPVPEFPPELTGPQYVAALAEWRRRVCVGAAVSVPEIVASMSRKALDS